MPMSAQVPADRPERMSSLERLAVLVTLVLAMVPAVLWPGDTPWILDEPQEVAIALQANQHHELASHGLTGNFYLKYGPLPMQIYQVMLLFSHDPRVLVVLRGALCSVMTAGSLLWLGRSLRLNLWFATAVVLAPQLWLNNRSLWAANVAIPIGTLALAAYASFLRTGSGWSFVPAVGAAIAPLFIHPQAAPLSAAIIGHMLWRQRSSLWRHRFGVLAALGLLAILNFGYLRYATSAVYQSLGWSVRSGYPGRMSRMAALAGPLMGGRLFSGGEFDVAHCPLSGPAGFIATARVLASASIPLVWLGVGLSLCRWMGRRRACDETCNASPESSTGWHGRVRLPVSHATQEPSARSTLVDVALAGLVMQSLYFGILRVPPAPQYFFGTFALYVLLAWTAVDALLRLRAIIIAAYGLSLALITLSTIWHVHRDGWPRGTMSPTLNEQVELVRELNRYTDTSAWTDVSCYQFEKPYALWVLRMLYPQEPGQPSRTSGRLVIRYRTGPGGHSGRIELIEARGDADIPPNARRVSLYYPYPK
jgi:hypothetical protein